jgi:hypothetical protein
MYSKKHGCLEVRFNKDLVGVEMEVYENPTTRSVDLSSYLPNNMVSHPARA